MIRRHLFKSFRLGRGRRIISPLISRTYQHGHSRIFRKPRIGERQLTPDEPRPAVRLHPPGMAAVRTKPGTSRFNRDLGLHPRRIAKGVTAGPSARGEQAPAPDRVSLPGPEQRLSLLTSIRRRPIKILSIQCSPLDKNAVQEQDSSVSMKGFTANRRQAMMIPRSTGLRFHSSPPPSSLLSRPILATVLLALFTAAQAQSAFIRLNQVGYVSGSSKRAYLMASGSEAGATFLLKNSSGVTVYSAPVGSSLGAGAASPTSIRWILIPSQPPARTPSR